VEGQLEGERERMRGKERHWERKERKRKNVWWDRRKYKVKRFNENHISLQSREKKLNKCRSFC